MRLLHALVFHMLKLGADSDDKVLEYVGLRGTVIFEFYK